ncbi:MAG TPA: HlyD family efflux transporter periplasmic adaptor subunit [Solirubrobacteraceae bacterium]|nr:HlyD family efflux transporter periplasmic adaptor subunit [Solirubrobacteraceae bacterium]
MSTRRDRPSRPWFLYALAVVAVAVAVLAITEIGPPTSSARTSKQVVTAEQGVVQSSVTGSGNIAAGTDDTINFNTSGTLQDVYVHVGQHVHAGQLLADLDPTSAQLSLNQANASLTSAQDNLNCAEGETSYCGSGGSGSTGAGSSGSTGSSSTTSYSAPASTVEYAAFHPGTGTTPSKPTKKPTTGGTKVTKKTPSVTVTVVVPPTSTSRTGSSGGGSSAPKTTSTTTTTSTPSPGSIASAQASVYSAQAGVHNAETALNNTKLYAPVSGTVASLSSLTPGAAVSGGGSGSSSSSSNSSSSSSSSGSGTTAGSLGGSGSSSSSGSSSGFAEIVNTSTLTMTVAFSESDISKVHVGQPATVTLDALSGVELAAHVSSISLVGTTSSSVVSYDATLVLDQNDSRVKPGMSASASVITGQASGVTLPNSAVTGTGSLATVNMLKSGKTVAQQVVVGLRGDSRTQIISGLSAGDQVVVTVTLPTLGSSSTTGGTGSGTLGRGLGGGGLGGGGAFPGGGGGGGFLRRAAGGG